MSLSDKISKSGSIVAPQATQATTTNNLKKSQYWANFGIIADKSNCSLNSGTGFAQSGMSTFVDDIDGLKKRTCKGSEDVVDCATYMADSLKGMRDNLNEGEHHFVALGCVEPESLRKERLIELLKKLGINTAEEVAEVAFPSEGPKWGIEVYRVKASQGAQKASRMHFKLDTL